MSKRSLEFEQQSDMLAVYLWVRNSFAIGTATAASLVINRYQGAVISQRPRAEQRPSRAASSFGSWLLSDHFSWSSESEQSQLDRLLKTIPDPGPVHLVVACLAYSIAINVFYHTHKRDRYQLGIAACGTLSTLAVGWASKEDTQNVVTGLGLWAVVASLLLSAAFHRLLRDYGGEARISL